MQRLSCPCQHVILYTHGINGLSAEVGGYDTLVATGHVSIAADPDPTFAWCLPLLPAAAAPAPVLLLRAQAAPLCSQPAAVPGTHRSQPARQPLPPLSCVHNQHVLRQQGHTAVISRNITTSLTLGSLCFHEALPAPTYQLHDPGPEVTLSQAGRATHAVKLL